MILKKRHSSLENSAFLAFPIKSLHCIWLETSILPNYSFRPHKNCIFGISNLPQKITLCKDLVHIIFSAISLYSQTLKIPYLMSDALNRRIKTQTKKQKWILFKLAMLKTKDLVSKFFSNLISIKSSLFCTLGILLKRIIHMFFIKIIQSPK